MKNKAKQILNDNWRDGYTVPCKDLYPFQWLWDSGLIAIGYAHYDMSKAKKELETLLNAQWKNGFIPHMIFHKKSETYFPGPNFHSAILHPNSNKDYPSTGLTQPPILGFVLEKIYQIANNNEGVLNFIKTVIDKVYLNHQYLYENRDLNNEGLLYIYHNWESGTDNSPAWDAIWETMNPTEYSFERRDTTHVNPEQRPTKREYDHYLYMIDLAKSVNYNDAKIAEISPFLVQDPLYNSMLIKSNNSLIKLYELIGGNSTKVEQLKKWQEKSITSFNNKLFNKELGAYIYYDLRNDKPINVISSSSFAPLYAGIPAKKQAAQLVNTLTTKFGGEDLYLCASFDPTSEKFDPKKYWRGPVWINLNWLLYYGLQDYGYHDLAQKIKSDTIEILEKVGFYEYFDPRKSEYNKNIKGYGGSDFSWSASLFLDLINN
ncbi:trehalase family glycosidase [Lutibacter sp.]|uniref:MGH1-like glycoside hydrolase domain-containing protein n=1 Tax=Lutibacter sp. TaxID=1925666 RepID=UPI0025C1FCFA|nr:trehalase family glycosidase [Lutibacter sp.]MCF6181361.1 glycoside hydrolase [Lutibacter sp.]